MHASAPVSPYVNTHAPESVAAHRNVAITIVVRARAGVHEPKPDWPLCPHCPHADAPNRGHNVGVLDFRPRNLHQVVQVAPSVLPKHDPCGGSRYM